MTSPQPLVNKATGVINMVHPGLRFFLVPVTPNEKYHRYDTNGFPVAAEFTFPVGVRKAMMKTPEPLCGSSDFIVYGKDGGPVTVPSGASWTAPNGEVLS